VEVVGVAQGVRLLVAEGVETVTGAEETAVEEVVECFSVAVTGQTVVYEVTTSVTTLAVWLAGQLCTEAAQLVMVYVLVTKAVLVVRPLLLL